MLDWYDTADQRETRETGTDWYEDRIDRMEHVATIN